MRIDYRYHMFLSTLVRSSFISPQFSLQRHFGDGQLIVAIAKTHASSTGGRLE